MIAKTKKRTQIAFLMYFLMVLAQPIVFAATLTYAGLIEALANIFLPTAIGAVGIPLILVNAYKLMTSQGDPQRVRDGREGLTAAIVGVLFLFFSMTILNILLNSFFGVS